MKLISWNVNGLRAVINKGFEDFFKEANADIFCLQETKMQVEQLGEDAKKIFKDSELNILQVSRLVEQKGIDRLIKVHAKLINEGYKHHIFIIGDGPLRDQLERQIKEYDVEKTFTLLGSKNNPYEYMKNADAVCLFSKFEGYPMVIEEAKILRKPILTTNTSSREVLANYPGYNVIVKNDEEGIENAIKSLNKDRIKLNEENNNYSYANKKVIDKIIKTIEQTKKKRKYRFYGRMKNENNNINTNVQ